MYNCVGRTVCSGYFVKTTLSLFSLFLQFLSLGLPIESPCDRLSVRYLFNNLLVYYPHENQIYMRHIQLFGMKIYFEGLGIIYVKYILANIFQKIYAKYILIIQLFAKIYFIYFYIYVTYIFFHVGSFPKNELAPKNSFVKY